MNSLLNELMLGNVLYYKGKYKILEVEDLVNIQNRDTGYRRIELTSEILERMKFYYNYSFNGEMYKVSTKYNIGISLNSVIQIINNKAFIIPNLKLNYLHDLQNYIYINFNDRL